MIRVAVLVIALTSFLPASAQAQAFGVTKHTPLSTLRPMETGVAGRLLVSPPEPHELLPYYAAELGPARNVCAITGISEPMTGIDATMLEIGLAELLDGKYGPGRLVARGNRMLTSASYEKVWARSAGLDAINLTVAPVEGGGQSNVLLRYAFEGFTACMALPAPSARGL